MPPVVVVVVAAQAKAIAAGKKLRYAGRIVRERLARARNRRIPALRRQRRQRAEDDDEA